MYAATRGSSTLRGWEDFPCPAGQWRTTDPATGQRVCEEDPSLVMQHCVLTKPGELPGAPTQDPNCPAGFTLEETTAGDFAPGGVFAEGGGGVVANLAEWEVGPDGWLVYQGTFDPEGGAGDAPTVHLGLEYDPSPTIFSSAALPWLLGLGVAGALLARGRF